MGIEIGARYAGDGRCEFIVWAPQAHEAAVKIICEEYAEEAPFLYFVSHGDADLIRAVREGRKAEFKAFQWAGEPPDPHVMETFLRSKLDWDKRRESKGRVMRVFYRELLRLRRETPALAALDKNSLEVSGREEPRLVFLRRWNGGSRHLTPRCHPAVGKSRLIQRMKSGRGRVRPCLKGLKRIRRRPSAG